MQTAIDVSQWAGEITTEQFRQAKTLDCSRVIIALNDLELAERQIRAALNAGLEVEAYSYLYFSIPTSIKDQIDRDIEVVKRHPQIKRLWMDAEDTRVGVTPEKVIMGLRTAEYAIVSAGLKTGIYTGRWYWVGHVNNTQAFNHLNLWDAYWDKNPDIDTPSYGGWTEAYMSQWKADTHYHETGIWCDINSYIKESDDIIILSQPLEEKDIVELWEYTMGYKPRGVKVTPISQTLYTRTYEVELPVRK